MLWNNFTVGALLGLLLTCMLTFSAQAEVTLTDPRYVIKKVASGLGAGNAMAADRLGNLFVLDYHDTGIGRIHWFHADGSTSEITTNLLYQDGIAILPDRSLLVATNDIHQVTLDGVVTPYITGLSFPGHFERKPNTKRFSPQVDGDLYFPEAGVGRILILHQDGSLDVFATGLNNPNNLAFDYNGHLWVAEHNLGEVVELDENGQIIRRVTGFTPFGPVGFEFWNGSLFLTNPQDATISRIEKDGSWSVFATGFTGKGNPPAIGPIGVLAVRRILFVSDADTLWAIRRR